MFPKIGVPPNHLRIRFSLINHPFWGPTPIFGNTHIVTTIDGRNPAPVEVGSLSQ